MPLTNLKDLPSWEWPPETAARLLDVLRGPGAPDADLMAAVKMASDPVAINDDLATALVVLAEDVSRSGDVRAQAAISLGPVLEDSDMHGFEIEDPAISEPTFRAIQTSLRRLSQDAGVPTHVRRMALEAAVRAGQDWHAGAVRAAFTSDDPAWRLTAISCARFVRGFDREILQALESSDPLIRRHAVEAAGHWEIAAAWPHVAPLVADARAEKALRLAAISAIATIRPDEAKPMLADLLDAEDEEIAGVAREAIEMAKGISGELDDEDLADEF